MTLITPQIPGTRHIGDTGHVGDHNTIQTSGGILAQLAARGSDFINAAEKENLLGTGVDESTKCQNAINATPAGGVCYFPTPPVTYGLGSAGLIVPSNITVLGPRAFAVQASPRDVPGGVGNAAPALFTMVNGANLDYMIADTGYTSLSTSPVATGDTQIVGVDIDANGSNQSGGLGQGIVLMSAASSIHNVRVRNTLGHGIMITDTSKAGHLTSTTALNENSIDYCRIYQPGLTSGNGIYISSQGSLLTDGYMEENVVDFNFSGPGTNVAIALDKAGDWSIRRNHVYACQGDAFHIFRAAHAFIDDNYADNFGSASVLGTTYYAFKIQVDPFGACNILNNTASTKEAAGGGAGNFIYFFVTSQGTGQVNDVFFSGGNVCRQISATSGTSTAYSFNPGSGGTMTIRGITSPFIVQGSTISATPILTNGPTFPDFSQAAITYSPSNPASTTSATKIMGGLNLAYTPLLTGRLRIIMYGGDKATTAASGHSIGLRYSTSTFTAGAAVSGTTVGKDQAIFAGSTGNPAPWTITGIASGLTVGTTYNFDIAYAGDGTNACNPVNLYAIIEEVA